MSELVSLSPWKADHIRGSWRIGEGAVHVKSVSHLIFEHSELVNERKVLAGFSATLRFALFLGTRVSGDGRKPLV